jgi:hypothetical protein
VDHPSRGWTTFLRNQAANIAVLDLIVVPTIGSPHQIFGKHRQLLVAGETAPSAIPTALRSACTGAFKSPRTIVRQVVAFARVH